MHQREEDSDPIFSLGFKALFEMYVLHGEEALVAANGILRERFFEWLDSLKKSGEFNRRAEEILTKADPSLYVDEDNGL